MSINKIHSADSFPKVEEDLSARLDDINSRATSLLYEVKEFRGMISDVMNTNDDPAQLIPDGSSFYSEVERFETCLIEQALKLSNGNRSRAARRLSLKLSTLNSKIKRYNLKVDWFKDSVH
jgi:transcriptional regulator with GAF, ATPase, and Fis domain